MREVNLSQSPAKRRLLETAEQLLAERGFEMVSVRDITQLAKANVAAINYHFGTREGLLDLIITRHLGPINEERLVRLDQLEAKYAGKIAPLEEILDAFIRPLLGNARKTDLPERLWCRLLGFIFARDPQDLPPAMGESQRVANERFGRALAKALPSVTAEDLTWRSHFMVGAMIHMLTNQQLLLRAAVTVSLDATLSRFVRFAAAGLRDGVELEVAAPVKKGPQAMFDF